ncbi:MAG: hypothetical protein HC918_03940 [Oscillatoriales cyanobacterium SM2_1_8]|nr:hypothetical protein [Oscillatoriales cyanobacterium SM2_1_8]
MINIGGNPLMILLAIVAALGGVGLYFVRSFKPQLARDHDIFFSAIALVYGIILLAFNFRMEITTQLAQVLVVSFAGWFAVESLTLRQLVADQARQTGRNLPDFEPEGGPDLDNGGAGGYGFRGGERYDRDGDLRAELDGERASRRSIGVSRRMRGTPEDMPAELGDGRSNRRSRRSRGGEPENWRDRSERGTGEEGFYEDGLEDGGEVAESLNRSGEDVIEIDDRDIQPLTRRSRNPESDSERAAVPRSRRRRRSGDTSDPL